MSERAILMRCDAILYSPALGRRSAHSIASSQNDQNSNNNQNHNHNQSNQSSQGSFRGAAAIALATVAVAGTMGLFAVVTAAEADIDSRRRKPRLVILGSGWAAVGVIKGLVPGEYDVTVVSPRSAFVFTPLLPSACVGSVESRSLVESMRKMCANAQAHFVQAGATDVDFGRKTVVCKDEHDQLFELPYDRLVVAVGAHNNTFNTPGVEKNCHFLKQVQDARDIRAKIMDNFEQAALPTTPVDEKRRLLHFLIVGGGPTGVEVAAEIADLVRDDLVHLFPELCQKYVSVSLVQSADHILNTYDESISLYAEKKFKMQNINVITRARVLQVNPTSVEYTERIDGKDVPKTLNYGMCVWSTGIKQVPLVETIATHLDKSQNHRRALVTDSRLRVIGAGGDMFAIGDCATMAMPHLLTNVKDVFSEADENNDGVISYEEFEHMCNRAVERYPQMEMHVRQLKKLFSQYDADDNRSLDLAEFGKFLADIDKQLKAFPATAQVASQQGKYIARQLNYLALQDRRTFLAQQEGGPASTATAASEKAAAEILHQTAKRQAATGIEGNAVAVAAVLPEGSRVVTTAQDQERLARQATALAYKRPYKDFEPFHYHHMGSLAYIGHEDAAIDFGGGITGSGTAAFFLWRGAYLSNSVTVRVRVAIALDWLKLALFGRDFSRF
ncbi:NADH dehydrogenase [Capsaspora owczarzaki ATCC 30864]|uniref:NADH dehydrogenase n=1 Tax=Capsaspora owczarzaki (strain ATCC 30864) TaxID=595528 RepID=UPI0001FE367C|nr:NADH dehydrogenase [Capsaspora owczarzaki ATCC 30864]|eukprot:XP_004365104.1 NADH dehydrogenase [Capsaspora owczarzaki ATCC 30864]